MTEDDDDDDDGDGDDGTRRLPTDIIRREHIMATGNSYRTINSQRLFVNIFSKMSLYLLYRGGLNIYYSHRGRSSVKLTPPFLQKKKNIFSRLAPLTLYKFALKR